MNKKLAAALLLTGAIIGAAGAAHSVVIEEGTIVLVKVLDRVTTKNAKSGDIVLFTVAREVENDDFEVVIRKGADAFGHVVDIPLDKPASLDVPPEPDMNTIDGRAQAERQQKLREKALRKLARNPRSESEDLAYRQNKREREAPRLGITIDRAVTVTGQEVALIADVAERDTVTMVPETKKASMDVKTMHRLQAREQAFRKYNVPVSPDAAASADVTLVVPWNVFTTGTYSVLEPGTVLRARVLETTDLKGNAAPQN